MSDGSDDESSLLSGVASMDYSDGGGDKSKKRSKRFLSKDDYDDSEIDDDIDDNDDHDDIEHENDDNDGQNALDPDYDTDHENDEDEDEDDNRKEHKETSTKINVDENSEDDQDDEDDTEVDLDQEMDEETSRKKRSYTGDVAIPIEHSLFHATVDSDDDDDEDDSEDYLQKFDAELNKNYIQEYHPECLNHNSDEVAMLATVVRDATGTIVDPLHRTLPFLTKYEKARVLGQRAKQIEVGALPYIEVPETIVDGYLIAEMELRDKKIPFIIKRPIPGGAMEYWHVSDLENINF